MRRARNTKILSTLGPATANEKSIRALYEAGADVFRLNFSHGSHADHRANVDTIRRIEAEVQRPIAILMDLQGPKLRVGKIKDGKVTLKEGQKYRFDLDPTEGDDKRAPLLHPEVFAVLTKGSILLLDDGKLRARVDKALDDGAEVTLMNGGVLSNHKGLNVPNVVLPLSAMTQKDRDDLQFGLDIGVDWVGLSFVQRPDDVAELRKLVAGRAAIMTKMEKPAAMLRLDEIVDLSDAVMVARGDLGVECPPEDVPALQKKIVRACRAKGRPVVVATQMLESMINSPAPTRAEASDVATAVYDGADAANSNPSRRSNRPPCPGMIDPESFTPSRLFNPDSARSPICDTTDKPNARKMATFRSRSFRKMESGADRMIAASTPPMAPDQVLFGLMAGASFGPPRVRPAAYAPISVDQMTTNSHSIQNSPSPALRMAMKAADGMQI